MANGNNAECKGVGGREGGREIERARYRGRGSTGMKREWVQLKLAQFSHSPVIRVPGVYIIKSRKFLSPPLIPVIASTYVYKPHPLAIGWPCRASFSSSLSRARVFSIRPNVAASPRLSSQQGSNSGLRSELRLIALIARTRRLYYSLFNLALRPRRHSTFQARTSPGFSHPRLCRHRVSTSVLFPRVAKTPRSK